MNRLILSWCWVTCRLDSQPNGIFANFHGGGNNEQKNNEVPHVQTTSLDLPNHFFPLAVLFLQVLELPSLLREEKNRDWRLAPSMNWKKNNRSVRRKLVNIDTKQGRIISCWMVWMYPSPRSGIQNEDMLVGKHGAGIHHCRMEILLCLICLPENPRAPRWYHRHCCHGQRFLL